ncbi:hypothetical protein KPL42_07980 [Clostridium gasigenes]|uniref:hypothetical protein n=1 Tax=Clostridium gasigenes TaxID=94869 RepID=UPI001C0D8971|nr:hypothetical protein [Clostridium gasigenes]MBU3088430.1 hypothetical protein [Clostridium gasigenes]
MKKIKLDKNNSVMVIVGVLMVSLLLNIYTSVMNSKYKMKAGRESYRYIEEIKHRNESALVILDQSIETKSISNEELLSLYKSYNSILDSTVQLCDSYSTYKNSNLIREYKEDEKNKIKQSEVYSRIENLVFEYLNLEMKNEQAKIVLDGKILNDFIKMKEVSNDVQDFFNEFNQQYLSNLKDEKREEKIIKKDYWIDMYLGVNKATEKNIDYPFIIKSKN